MKKILTLILFLVSLLSFAQPSDTECFETKMSGFLIKTKYLQFKIDDKTYLLERYSKGMGIFRGAERDTLVLNNHKLTSNNFEIEFINSKKYIITFKENKKRCRFKISDKNNTEILRMRNLTFREEIKYKLENKELSNEFVKRTNALVDKLNHEDFILEVEKVLDEIKKE